MNIILIPISERTEPAVEVAVRILVLAKAKSNILFSLLCAKFSVDKRYEFTGVVMKVRST